MPAQPPSSDPAGYNDLPPSSAVLQPPSSPGADGLPAPAAPPRARGAVDLLNLSSSRRATNGTGTGTGGGSGNEMDEDEDGDEADGVVAGRSNARLPRPRRVGRNHVDVPKVHDTTGESVMKTFQEFLESYTGNEDVDLDDDDARSEAEDVYSEDGTLSTEGKPYLQQIGLLREYQQTTLYVDFSHIEKRAKDDGLRRAIQESYYRFLPFLRRALTNLIKKYEPTHLYVHGTSSSSSNNDASGSSSFASSGLLTKEFSIAFHNLSLSSGIRELRMEKIGTLMSISGTVTRTSEVRPELVFGSFTCMLCRLAVHDVEQQFKYTEPMMCQNLTCANQLLWTLNVEMSKFTDWQKVRIQENSDEIPTGSMPRSLDVILRGDTVERAKAGDKCTFTGTFIVVPDVAQMAMPGLSTTMQKEARRGGGGNRGEAGPASQGISGLKELGVRDLGYKTAFLACHAINSDARSSATNVRDDTEGPGDPESFKDTLTTEEADELAAMVRTPHIYARLVASIAPTVYGHEIVKKGILLQLLGGVHKKTLEGTSLRGDINICIVGDPSTSKSQFLKYVCGFLPRAVYTSGKASSAAGLTAAVVKDEETGEFTIEAGALMLADNGICAIDEFDKMDISDQVAIHEAMEQQTISISKAGIQATLNARTSILAAANPVGGRYNRKMSLRANVAMSAPIMSRFDLFFVVLDECNEEVDFQLATHIVNVHRFRDAAIAPEFTTEALQRYIRYARTFKPKLTPASSAVLVEKYRQLRTDDAGGPGKNSYRITVRQLESMIRLSEAIARANCRDLITPPMVREAFSLLRQSIIHVEMDDIEVDDDEDQDNPDGDHPAPDGGGMDVDGGEQEDGDAAQMAAEIAAAVEAENSYMAASEDEMHGETPVPEPAPAKKKMKITYDKYMKIMYLIVGRVAEAERTDVPQLEREELIEWYMLQRESEIESLEELEQERELIGKALNKLVKDQYLIEFRGVVKSELASSQDQQETTEDVDPNQISYMLHDSLDMSELGSSAT